MLRTPRNELLYGMLLKGYNLTVDVLVKLLYSYLSGAGHIYQSYSQRKLGKKN
jgi:hypothetical protein